MTTKNSDRSTASEALGNSTSQVDRLERVGRLGTWNIDFLGGQIEFSPWLSRTLNVPTIASKEDRAGLFVDEDHESARSFLTHAALERMPFTVVSRLRPRASKEVIWFRHCGDPTFDALGKLTGYIGVSQRIDREIAANQQRVAFEETLQRVQRDEGTSHLVGALTHELLNLFQPVLFLSDLASMANDAGDTKGVHDHLANIETATTDAVSLLRSALDFARLDSDDLEPVSVSVLARDLNIFVDRELLNQVNLHIADDVSDAQFLATRRGVVQLTLNLLKNASEASAPDRPIDVHVARSLLVDKGVDVVRISVLDQGTGFSDEALARAFDPRFTTRITTTGNGLGLAVVRSMVEGWGGTISIGNHPAGGARVEIQLPVLDGEPPRATRLGV